MAGLLKNPPAICPVGMLGLVKCENCADFGLVSRFAIVSSFSGLSLKAKDEPDLLNHGDFDAP